MAPAKFPPLKGFMFWFQHYLSITTIVDHQNCIKASKFSIDKYWYAAIERPAFRNQWTYEAKTKLACKDHSQILNIKRVKFNSPVLLNQLSNIFVTAQNNFHPVMSRYLYYTTTLGYDVRHICSLKTIADMFALFC